MNNNIDLALNELQYIAPPVSDPTVLNEFRSVSPLKPKLAVVAPPLDAPTYSYKSEKLKGPPVLTTLSSLVDVFEEPATVNVIKNALSDIP